MDGFGTQGREGYFSYGVKGRVGTQVRYGRISRLGLILSQGTILPKYVNRAGYYERIGFKWEMGSLGSIWYITIGCGNRPFLPYTVLG